MRVIETFDRAQSLREVKLVYTTLAESVQSKVRKVANKKATVTEGLASKAQKTTKPKQVIAEGNVMASRMKKLAGLL
jgi:pantothenate kinase